jgi:hypothetical protein
VPALTVQDLITDALEELAAVPAGDTPATQDLVKGLAVLKRFVEASNLHRGNIKAIRRDTRTLTAGTQSYTIGIDPSGVLTATFAAVRPIRIERASVLLTSGSGTLYEPLNLITVEDWSEKTTRSTQSLPKDLFTDEGAPLTTWRFDPIPDQNYTIETWTWQQFAQSALADVLTLPQGYYEYWVYGLAIRLAAAYGKDPRATTVALFDEARQNVMALNLPSPRMASNADLDDDQPAGYNWLDGGNG